MFKFFGKLAKAFGASKAPFTSVIILCAGASTRFGSDKQMVNICGKGVAERTIGVFESVEQIDEIVLVVPKESTQEYQDIVLQNEFKKVRAIVTGGETRQISASRGLRHVSEKAKYIAVHDGARCLVTPEMILTVLVEAVENKCATAACQMTDTIKLSTDEGFVKRTVDRSLLWSVQTPQIFEAELYKVATYKAMQEEIEVTDDCMLAENAGFKIKLVETGKDNIKITRPADVALAEYILANRKESEL
ncbi:MAG: 2-C-methyl-D-erythritol 4-phosphate cytidylyltransferase [Clostridia bacterium]|nr:2-C-methyl-D-erythritol 4-phosphate cytidylyltransferase [Clostridia bacterium]